MNQVYRVIWNATLGIWVAVSELAKSKTKSKTVGAVGLLTSMVVFLPGAFAQVGTTGGTGSGTAISSCTGGTQANSGTDSSNIVIGCSATSGTSTRSVAIGDNATTSGANSQSVAVGSVAAARGDQSVAVGNNVNANGNSSIAIGGDDIDKVRNDTTASKSYQTITGGNLPTGYPETTATGGGAVVVGVTAQAKGNFSSAFGMAANAVGDASVALGTTSVAGGQGALAIGAVSNAKDNGSIAIGINTSAQGLNSTAIGSGSSSLTGSQTTGDYATAIGSGSNAVAGATAIGSGAKAKQTGGVAIGSDSISSTNSGTLGYDSVTGQNSSDTTGVWKSTNAAVSIGNGSSLTRQITGLAAGQQDTDAVNVAQLKSTRTIATNNLKTAIGTSASTDTNGNLTISNIAGTGKSNLNDAIATVKQSADDQFAKLKTEGNQTTQGKNSNTSTATSNTLTDGTNQTTTTATGTTYGYTDTNNQSGTVVNKDGLSIKKANGTNGASITSTGIDAGGQKVTNVADGAVSFGSKDAVNGGQLAGVSTSVQNILGGQAKVDSTTGKVTTFNIGGTGQDTVDAAVANVKDQATKAKTTVSKGDNIAVTMTKNDDGSTNYQVATTKDLKVNSITATDGQGNTSVLGATGTTVTSTDGSGKSISANYGASTLTVGTGANPVTVDGSKGTITGLTNTKWSQDSAKDSSAAATTGQVADVNNILTSKFDDLSTKGLTISDSQGNRSVTTATGTTVSDKGNSHTNASTATSNILADGAKQVTTTATGTTYGYTDANNQSGTVVNQDGLSFRDSKGNSAGPSITAAGLNAGNTTVKNVAAGTITSASTDAVNGSQLFTVSNSIKNILGGNANTDANGNLTMSNIAGTGKSNLNDAILTASAKAKTTVTSSDNNLNVSTTTSADGLGTTYTISGKADQNLNSVKAGNTSVTTTGVIVDDGINKSNSTASQTILSNANSANKNIAQADSNSLSDGSANRNIAKADSNSLSDSLGNINVSRANVNSLSDSSGNLNISTVTGNTIKKGNNSNTSTATSNTLADGKYTNTSTAAGTTYGYADTSNLASTTVNQDGLSFKDSKGNGTGPSVTAAGLNAGNLKVTNVQDGTIATNSKDAVNGGQVANISQSVANAIGGVQVNQDGTITNPSYSIAGGKQTTVSDALNALSQGFSVTSNGASSQAVKAGDALDIGTAVGEKNLTVSKTGNNIKYALNRNLDVDSVQAGNSRLTTDTLTVGQASPVTVDGSKGTITGLTNTTWTADSAQNRSAAASTGQVADVKQSADDQFAKLKTEGNKITQGNNSNTSTATSNTLADGKYTNTSTAAGTTYGYADANNQSGTVVNQDGLSIKKANGTNGASITSTGIDAGSQKVTNVADGLVASGAKDAVNGGQLADVSTSVQKVLGGQAKVDSTGKVTTSNIGGTGQDTVDAAVANVKDQATKAKTTLSTGDNIAVTTTQNDDGSTNYQVATAKDLKVNSITATDDQGHTSVLGTTGTTVTSTDSSGKSISANYGASTLTVGTGANPVTVDGSKGTITGLTNTTWTADSAQNRSAAASTGQVADVKQSADDQFAKLKTEGNKITQGNNSNTSTATSNTLADGKYTNTSTAAGTTYGYADANNQSGTVVNQDGLSIKKANGTNGASITSTGIDAGSQKVTNVADGLVVSGAKDAVNGGQLADVSTSVQKVLGGQAKVDSTGKVTTSNIGGTGQDTVDAAVANVKDQATKAKTTLSTGDNIAVTTTQNDDGSTNYQVATAKDLKVNSITATDDQGHTSVLGTTGTTVTSTDSSGKSISANYGASTLTVGTGANPVTVDGSKGTITGLTNTTWTADSAQNRSAAASTGQVADVKQSADDQFAKLKTEGNKITQGNNSNTSTATSNTLADGKYTNTSTAAGTTYGYADANNQSGTVVNQDGLSIKKANGTNGASITSTGIDAGSQKVTNVADGLVASGAKDAVNGGQLADVSTSVQKVLGGQAKVDSTGKVTTSNIGGTGQDTVDAAVANVKDQATKAKTTLSTGDNIAVTTTQNDDGSTNYQVATAKDLKVNSITATDDQGHTSVLGTTGTTVTSTDSSGKSISANYGASTLTVGTGANPVTVDGSKGTITGLTNTTWTADSAQNRSAAASTGQVADVKQSADDQFAKLKTEGNKITQGNNSNTSTATSNTLADGKYTNTSTAAGTTYGYADANNQSGTVVNQDGLSIKKANGTNGASITSTGIDAGSQKVTNVADGLVASGAKDAVNGGQLADVSTSVQKVLGGQAKVDSTGKVTTSNIGGTGQDTVDAAVANVKDQATKAKTTLSTGDNIAVTTTQNDDGSTNYQVATAKDLKVNSITATDDQGHTSVLGTTGTTVTSTDSSGKSISANYGASTLTVGTGANPVTVDGSKGTITGLTNTTWTADSAQNRSAAASTGQVADVKQSADDQFAKLKTEGNKITQGNNSNTSTATSNTLADGKYTNTSTAAGTTYGYADANNQSGTVVNQDGLSIKKANGTNGASITSTGIDAGSQKVTNVADGLVVSGAKDAVNGGQLADVSTSVQKVLGGQAKVDSTGKVTTSNIGGTGQDTVDAAVANVKDQATKAKTTLSTGDNIAVTTTQNDDGSTNYQVATAKDLKVNSITATDDQGHTSVLGTTGTTVTSTDSSGKSISANYGASTLTVGTGANPVTVDGSKGTITGLTNTTWTADSAQNRSAAASTGQVADVQSNLQEQLGTLGNNSVQYVANKDGSIDYNSIIAGNGKGTIATIGQDNFGNSVVTSGGTIISNVANGKNASDAVNKGQLDALSTYISNNVTNVQDGANNNVSVTGQVVNQNYTSGKNSNQDSLFLTYDKQGQTTTDQLTIGETVQKMNKEGVKFTHTNSADGKDSSAGAVNSTALGVNAFIKTGADNTIALGNSTFAESAAKNSVAIGNNSRVTGASSVAIGNNAIASGDQAISIGAQTKDTDGNTINSIASGTQSISIGTGNQVHGNHSGAFGDPSIINGTNSYSVGNNNNISTDNTFALGNGITQTMEGSVVLGNNSASRTSAGVGGYIPTNSTTIDQSAINTTMSTTGAIAVGDSQNNVYRQITGVAAGTADSDAVNVAQLKAVNNKVLALKTEGNTTSDNSGHSNASTATSNTLSDGTRTNTSTAVGTTYGYADASNQSGTVVNQDGLSFKDSKGNGTGPSVTATGLNAGNLKVTNVQDGTIATNSKDAVNGGQVANISQSVANAIGGVQVNQDGTITNPSYSIAGGKQTTISDALNALNQAVQNANTAGKDINVSKVTVSDQSGNNSVIGATGTIVKDNSGNNATTNAMGLSVRDSSGNSATYNASNTTYKAADNSGTSIGINGLSFSDTSGHKVGPSITASGIDAGGKSITGVAAGVNSTDAVNKGQLDSAVNNVNNTVNTLSTTAVQYDKNTDGSVNKGRVTLGDGTNATTLTNVADGQIVAGSKDAVNGGQLANVQSQVNENTNSINHLNSTVSDLTTGKSGAIQQADKNGDISIGKDTGGTKVSVANSTGATRTVTGISAGNVTSSSTDAVNGTQLYQSNAAMATVLGGNAQLQSNGTVSTSNIGGTGQNTIDGAVGNLNGRVGNLESAFVQTNQQLSKLRNETNAGIAGAMAVGNLPQPSEAGMSMVSAGVGGYRGEGAVSVGVSAITDSNKYIWKFGASADTRSNVSGAISVGYQWK